MRNRAELYQLKRGARAWYFTDQRKAIIHAGIEYLPIRGLQRTAIEDESIDKCDTEVTFPQMHLFNAEGEDLAAIFAGKIFYGGVTITILELYQGETLVLHKGRVTQPKYDEDADTLTLVCETGESYLNRNILTRKFQYSCPNSIYDRWCGLKFEDWAFDITVTAISGLNVTFTVNPTQVLDAEGNPMFDEEGQPVMETKSYPDQWLDLGLMLKGGVHTLITTSTANSFTLYRQHVGLAVGDVFSVVPGCDQSKKMCDEKFKNWARYAGHQFIPNSNPIYTQLIK
ncbi:phage BR0599 family protein [Acinetobacter sp. BSP-153]|uniref:phage BR0599 family protein n=1 Tax=Acinetobacter sp. BSP-153 TaxID=3344663 RepID=UPI00376FD174